MTTRRWIKIGAGLGIGAVSLISFFTVLTLLYNFEIIDISGNIKCEGTYENPCISEFDIKNQNPYVVDIYSKDQVKLDFSPDIYDYALFVKDGRCKSTTGKCACELKDGRVLGFAGWRCVDFTNKTKPRKDKVYNFRFPAYTTKHFLLAGLKNNPSDKIKWGVDVDNRDYLDPVWLPKGKEVGEELGVNSVRIGLTQFGGKEITQTEIDKNYPCYLQSDGSIFCPKIKDDKFLELSKKEDVSKGIPKTDLRKPVYVFNRTEKYIDEDGKEFDINISDFAGHNTTYLNYNIENRFNIDYLTNGKVRVGFKSNIFIVTDFSYGSCVNCTAKSYGVALENEHADSDANMVLWLQMTDDATDSSGNGNDGTVTGATHNFSHYEFDGDGDYINCGDDNSLNLTNNFTGMAWVNFKGGGGSNYKTIFAKRSGINYQYHFRISADRELSFLPSTGGSITGDSINLNEWTHVAFKFTDGNVSLWINGVLSKSETGKTINYVATPVLIGDSGEHVHEWNGTIDEVLIYNRSLSSSEITALYNKGLFVHDSDGNYTSELIDGGLDVNWEKIDWVYSNATENQNVTMKVRTGDTWYNVTAGDSQAGVWSDWTSEMSDSDGETLDLQKNRYVQFRAIIQTNDTKYTPILTQVRLYKEAFEVKLYGAYKMIFRGDDKLIIKN